MRHSPDSLNTRANLARRVAFLQKWHFANVGKSGESSQNGLANVGESGESSQKGLANMSESGESHKTVRRMSASLVSLLYLPKMDIFC